MIFLAKIIRFLQPTFAYYLLISKHTSSELIAILQLTEIFNLELCLFFFVNA
jgi:hypothetical protein